MSLRRIAVENVRNEKPQQQGLLEEPSLHSSPSRRRRAGRYVKRSEVRRLFAAPGADAIGARDAAMLTLLYGAGLLLSEAVALQLADYDRGPGHHRAPQRAAGLRDKRRQGSDRSLDRKPRRLAWRPAVPGRQGWQGTAAPHGRHGREGAGAYHRKAGGRRPGYPGRSPHVLDRAGAAAPRRPNEGSPQATGTGDAARAVPSALRRSTAG